MCVQKTLNFCKRWNCHSALETVVENVVSNQKHSKHKYYIAPMWRERSSGHKFDVVLGRPVRSRRHSVEVLKHRQPQSNETHKAGAETRVDDVLAVNLQPSTPVPVIEPRLPRQMTSCARFEGEERGISNVCHATWWQCHHFAEICSASCLRFRILEHNLRFERILS